MAKYYSGQSSEFAKILKGLTNRYQTWEIWADFVTMAAISISQTFDFRDNREERYLNIAGKYGEDEMMKFVELLQLVTEAFENDRDQDYLGSLYMELNLGNHWTGQFFTPYNVCTAMARMSVHDVVERIAEKGYITMNDCACGAGATLIAGVNEVQRQMIKSGSPLNFQNHVLVVAQDISETTALMCYIQLSMLGIAAIAKVGDSIMTPFNYDVLAAPPYDNLYFTPMYFSEVWTGRKMAHVMDMMIGMSAKKPEKVKQTANGRTIDLSDLI